MDLLTKIYNEVVSREAGNMELGRDFDNYETEVLKPLEENMSESQLEQVRELVYAASYQAELKGFQSGVRFMAESLWKSWEHRSNRLYGQ